MSMTNDAWTIRSVHPSETQAEFEQRVFGTKAWNRITWPCDRPDFLAWREAEDGWIEVLAYNNALGDVPHSMYVERAPSLAAIGFTEPERLKEK